MTVKPLQEIETATF